MSRQIDRIVRDVAERHGLMVHDLTGPAQWKREVRARFEAIWLARQVMGRDGKPLYSLPQIGRYFNRDHSTVLNALRRYEERSGRMAE